MRRGKAVDAAGLTPEGRPTGRQRSPRHILPAELYRFSSISTIVPDSTEGRYNNYFEPFIRIHSGQHPRAE